MALPEIDDDELSAGWTPLAADAAAEPDAGGGGGRRPRRRGDFASTGGGRPAAAGQTAAQGDRVPAAGGGGNRDQDPGGAARGQRDLLLLELLEREGYPVTKADYVDLRASRADDRRAGLPICRHIGYTDR